MCTYWYVTVQARMQFVCVFLRSDNLGQYLLSSMASIIVCCLCSLSVVKIVIHLYSEGIGGPRYESNL